jgi:hypothetical protein
VVAFVEDNAEVTIKPVNCKPGDSSWEFECREDQINDLQEHASKLFIRKFVLKLILPSIPPPPPPPPDFPTPDGLRLLIKESEILRSLKDFFDHCTALLKKDNRNFVECHMNCLFLHFNYEYR